ncbi:hypothetical protein P7C70_g7009, partial [Phenoliferia sp. Uapishka_3]
MVDPTSDNPLSSLIAKLALSPQSPHIQHALVRARRADSAFAEALALPSSSLPSSDSTDSIDAAWVRLRGRLGELEEALLEGGRAENAGLAREVRAVVGVLEKMMVGVRSTQGMQGRREIDWSLDGGSGEEDEERRRKLPPGQAQVVAVSSGRPTNAQLLDTAYASFLLCKAPHLVLPPGKSLAETLREREAPRPAPPPAPPIHPSSKEDEEERDRKDLLDGRLGGFLKELEGEKATKAWERIKKALWGVASKLVIRKSDSSTPLGDKRSTLVTSFLPNTESTTFSIISAAALLHSLAIALSQLCAPARDSQLQTLITSLSAPSIPTKVSPVPPPPTPSTTLSSLALLQSVSGLIRLSLDMAADLDSFKQTVKRAVDDKLLVRMAAWDNERAAVTLIYGTGAKDEEAAMVPVKESVTRWISERSGTKARKEWRAKSTTETRRGEILNDALIEAIFSDQPVSMEPVVGANFASIPTPSATNSTTTVKATTNALPSILLIQAPVIFRLQNFIQGILIIACLTSLASIPIPPSPTPDPLNDAWAQRIWALLRAEIDLTPLKSKLSLALEPAGVRTGLADLAEEILKIRKSSRGGREGEEVEDRVVRASVNRIIQYDDPVFKLLKSRAKEAVRAALRTRMSGDGGKKSGVPVAMATGIMGALGGGGKEKEKGMMVVNPVKGFGRIGFLGKKLKELAEEVESVGGWAGEVWGEKMGFELGFGVGA